jgi:FkbM family methyltransferase
MLGQALIDGDFETQMSILMDEVLRPGDTFIDIGANEGYFSVLAGLCGCRVYCIEPQTRIHEILERNFLLNGLESRIKIYPVALAARAGQVRLYLRPVSISGSSGVFRTGRFGWNSELVRAMTLDQIFQEERIGSARLIKMDCEGSEHDVIAGAAKVLQDGLVDVLALEFHPSVTPDAADACRRTHEKLLRYGYELANWNGQTIYHRRDLELDIGRMEARLGRVR